MAVSFRNIVLKTCRHVQNVRGSLTVRKKLYSTAAPVGGTEASRHGDAGEWLLASAVCIERQPVITQDVNKREEEFHELMSTIEDELSLLSDHELRHRSDLKLAELRKRDDYEETDASVSHQTALESEDAWENQLQSFSTASRTTEADVKNDLTSTNRKLDRKLVLLVKQKLGNKERWALPQLSCEQGESMIGAAERAVTQHCGDQMRVQFLSNAPSTFITRRNTDPDNNPGGTKVFVYKAHLVGGNLDTTEESEHVWVTKETLHSYLDKSYAISLQKTILEF